MRCRCKLLGCVEAMEAPCCFRCGAYIYDPEYVETSNGWLWPIRRRWWAVKAWAWPRCWECRRRFWPWSKRHHDDFCSETCFDKWIPF